MKGLLILLFATSAFANDIKVGASLPLSGSLADRGKNIQQGVEAYFKKVNASGGINGKKIEYIVKDDGYEPKKALENMHALVETDKVSAVVSTFGAPTTSAFLPYLEQKKIPLVAPIVATDLTSKMRENVFVLRPHSTIEATQLVKYVVEDLGIKEVGVFYQDDALGQSGLTGVSTALSEKNLRVMAKMPFKRNTTEVEPALKEMLEKKPKAVIMFGVHPGTTEFIKAVKAKGLDPVFAGGGGTLSPEFIKEATNQKIKYVATTACPLVTNTAHPLVKNYLDDMKAAGYSDVGQWGLEAYMNARLFVEAVRRAEGQASPEKLRVSLEGMNNVDLGGLSASFSPKDHQGRKTSFLVQIKDNNLVDAKP